MFSMNYRLVSPRRFEVGFKNINLNTNKVIVKPTYLSICNADQRYYQGLRQKEILDKKLPMSLIHEGIGKIIYDPLGKFRVGQSVVMIPNIPFENDDIILENYLRSSKFMSSNVDGFLQEYLEFNHNRIISVSENLNKSVLAFTELVSVSFHAITRFQKRSHNRKDIIGVWGDGNLGYITSLILKMIYKESKVIVFGVNESKLNDFTFVDKTYIISDIPNNIVINHAFECVGGAKSANAINQIIDLIEPEGTIAILGVSEQFIPINTRMILEKGLQIFGSSRSGRDDFINVLELYKKNPEILQYLENLIGEEVIVKNINDVKKAFEIDIKKFFGKTIIKLK